MTNETQTPLKDDEKLWALLSHLLALAGLLASAHSLGFLAPVIILLTKGKESAFVADQAKESLNFQITLLLVGIVLAAISLAAIFLTCGIGAFIVIPLLGLYALAVAILIIYAGIQAYNGEHYRYPINFRLIK